MDGGPGEFCLVYYLGEKYLLQLLREGRGTLVDWDLPFHLPGGPGRSTPVAWLAVQAPLPTDPSRQPSVGRFGNGRGMAGWSQATVAPRHQHLFLLYSEE